MSLEIPRGKMLACKIVILFAIPILWDGMHDWLGIGTFSINYAYASDIASEAAALLLSKAWWDLMLFTYTSFALSFVIGISIGVLLGIGSHLLTSVRAFYEIYAQALANVPKVILLPLMLLAFGYSGHTTAVVLSTLSTILNVSIGTHLAILYVSPDLIEVGRAHGATRLQIMQKIELPAALSQIIASFVPAYAHTLPIVLIAEYAMGERRGIGDRLFAMQQDHNVAGLLGVWLIFILINVVVFECIKRTTRWIRHRHTGLGILILGREHEWSSRI